MVIKKYKAPTETEAILLAKEELGKDAIVMNIKTITPKGIYKLFRKQSVEVTAAVDEALEEEKSPALGAIQKSLDKASEEDKKAILAVADVADKIDATVGISTQPTEIERRLDNLQELLVKQMQEKEEAKKEEDQEDARETVSEREKEPDTYSSYIQIIRNQLMDNEVDPCYADQVFGEIKNGISKDATLDNVLGSVYQKLVLKMGKPASIKVEEGKTKFVFFIGPTGVGKTTTIAKIASTIKLDGKAKLALITADTYRIAAVEQLKTYANILGVPLKVVYSSEEMEDVEEEFKDFDLVLVDTAGRSHNNSAQKEDMQNLLKSVSDEKKEAYLVLSATTKYSDLKKIANTYRSIVKYNLIFTKLDETDTIGNIYNIRMMTGAPLSYTTWGQNVPDDIGTINAQKIAKQLLGGKS